MNCSPQKSPLNPRLMTSSPRGETNGRGSKTRQMLFKMEKYLLKKRIKIVEIVTDLDKQMARCEVTFGLLGF